MSFSVDVKNELCSLAASDKESAFCQISAMLNFSRAFSKGNLLIQTENRNITDFLIDYLEDACSPILSLVTSPNQMRKRGIVFSLYADLEQDCQKIKDMFLNEDIFSKYNLMKNSTNCVAFLRGAFLVCGSMNDPNKEYHLEFVVPQHKWTSLVAELLSVYNIPIKYIKRKGQHVLYTKESECIEDLLTMLGATSASLEIMNIKIRKDIRNKVNRVTNCETANIEKTVAASFKQVEDIKLIQKSAGLDSLDKNLRKVAKLRMDNPEMSLSELVKEMNGEVSKSGLNHRLKKISKIADEYRKG